MRRHRKRPAHGVVRRKATNPAKVKLAIHLWIHLAADLVYLLLLVDFLWEALTA